jgi:hypothetical protein
MITGKTATTHRLGALVSHLFSRNHTKGTLNLSERGKQFWQKSSANDDPNRLMFIDVTRGLLLFWMIAAHALTLSGIGKASLLYFIRPPGWASHGFVMLSGFSVAALIVGHHLSGSELCRRLSRRAGQLLGWAFASEFLSRLLAGALLKHGQPITYGLFFDPAREWSISAFLIPTTIILVATALAARLVKAPSPTSLMSFGIMASMPASFFSNDLQAWVHPYTAILGIPLVLLVCLGFVGIGIGLLSKHLRTITLVIVPAFIGSALLIWRSVHPSFSIGFFLGSFLLTLSIGAILCMMPLTGFIRSFLKKMGQSALLIFISHRLILQIAAALAKNRLQDWRLLLFLLALSLSTLFCICLIKERNSFLRASLRRVGL